MSTSAPSSKVTSIAKAKPKLVIFDDNSRLLKAFVEKYEALGYAVTGVYVSDGSFDHLMSNGRFHRGSALVSYVDDWRVQDAMQMAKQNDDSAVKPEPMTVERALAEAQVKMENRHSRSPRERGMVQNCQGILQLPDTVYAVSSTQQAANILRQVDPDFVLSDLNMRKRSLVALDPLMGTDVMAMAGEICPASVRVLHSSKYTFYDQQAFDDKMSNPDDRRKYEQALADAADGGYLIRSKDADPTEVDRHTQATHQYFKASNVHGKPLGVIVPSATETTR